MRIDFKGFRTNDMMDLTGEYWKTRTRYRVIYGDTDQMGVAYYANYLRWFEMGRTEFLRARGSPYTSIERMGFRFPVIEVTCRYYQPAHYDEIILIETSLNSLGRAALRFNYQLTRQEGETVIAAGWTRHACVNQEGRATRLPLELASRLQSLVSPATSQKL